MTNNRKTKLLPIFIAIALVMGLGNAAANAASPQVEKEQTADWKFHDIVSVEFVQQHVKVPAPENVMLIDSRPARGKYDIGHIPTAVNIPDSQFEKMTDQLPKDKDTLLIFYCEGAT